MKKITQIITFLLLTATGLSAIEIQWQKELPINGESISASAGSDGSATVFNSSNDTLYWIGPNGNIIETILDFTGKTSSIGVNTEFVSGTQLVVSIYDFSDNFSNNIKVITKTESGHSIVTLDGASTSEIAFESSRPFFLTRNGTQFTLYKLGSTSQSSVGVTMVPANAIVIPASHQGDVTISLEASSDLVEWNNVLPGSYSSTDEARFFRVKAVTEN